MLKPVFTEKSLKMAKKGKYTFWVSPTADKISIKAEVARVFGVHVTDINTIKKAGEAGRTARGRKFNKLASKKAVVEIRDGEKIDIYEESKK